MSYEVYLQNIKQNTVIKIRSAFCVGANNLRALLFISHKDINYIHKNRILDLPLFLLFVVCVNMLTFLSL